MLNFAANISTMFDEWSFLDRPQAAADAGFGAIECQWPYEHGAEELARALNEAGLSLVLMNAPWVRDGVGGFGLASQPGLEHLFRESMEQALEYARALRCSNIHVMAGIESGEDIREVSRETYIENIRWAAQYVRDHETSILLEAINTQDVAGYHLKGNDDVMSVIKEVGQDNVFLQYDTYHTYRMGEDVIDSFHVCSEKVAHVQISGFPGRHEPLTGEIDHPGFFQKLTAFGYRGWIGCEYRPQAGTLEGLGWLKDVQKGNVS